MALNAAAKDAMLTQLGTLIAYGSLHTADPGGTGANEVPISGSPPYARKAITWGTASAGSMSDTGADPVFDVPTGTTITHLGFSSAVTAGTAYGEADITDEAFGAQGTYTVTSITLSIT
jgi:hypothetical protein